MILIIDNTQRKFRGEIRQRFLLENIPCLVADATQYDEYLPATFTVVTEKYLFDDAVYMAGMHNHDPVYLYEDVKNLYNYIVNTFSEQYGDIFGTSKISRVLIKNGDVLFCGKPLYLTPNEQRILTMLRYAPIDPTTKEKIYYTKEQLAAYCLEQGRSAAGAVAVHICNMNNKANKTAGVDIIECKRYKGYRLHIF